MTDQLSKGKRKLSAIVVGKDSRILAPTCAVTNPLRRRARTARKKITEKTLALIAILLSKVF
jgi:hypothetical protein